MSTITETIEELMGITGAKGCAIVDYESGMTLGKEGAGVDLDLAGAGNSEVVKAKLATMESLGLDTAIEDILITLGDQFHIIRLTPEHEGLFIYLILDKSSNLALARRKVMDVEKTLTL